MSSINALFRRGCAVILALSLTLTSLTSCMTTKTSVGQFAEEQGEVYKYAKGKQVWLFGGLLPIGRTNVNTPGDGDCEVVTRYNFGDALINIVTLGIVHTKTIKVNAKRVVPRATPTSTNE